MPIENNETILGTITTTDDVDISISPEAVRRFEQMLRRNAFDPYEEAKPLPKKVVKKKTTAQILDELSSKNCEVFDSVNKIQAEINAIEVDRIKELALKYDDNLFLIINKNYSLKGMSEAKMSAYINTLQQSLFQTLTRYLYNPIYGNLTEEQFEDNMLNYLSQRVIFEPDNIAIFKEMSKDLFKFMNDITEAKKKKKEIMGRQESKPTVCEDYLYPNDTPRTMSGTTSVRFEPAFTTTVSRGSSGLADRYVRPF